MPKFDATENIVGRTFVVHAGEDDFTGAAGNAGGRVACGIIEAAQNSREFVERLPEKLKNML